MPSTISINILPKLEKHVEAISALIDRVLILHQKRKSNILTGGEKQTLSYLIAEVADTIVLLKGSTNVTSRNWKFTDLAKLKKTIREEFADVIKYAGKEKFSNYLQGLAVTLVQIRQLAEQNNRSGFWEK